ncbi:MAG: hypothetical protein R3305_07475, partial [Gammaproteobacteria bacterium]|nr:hypothetical protein [Gammaproteobacteria bacterium]
MRIDYFDTHPIPLESLLENPIDIAAAVALLDLPASAPPPQSSTEEPRTDDDPVWASARKIYEQDLDAVSRYRPGYRVWHHVFSVPNGRLAFGNAADGSLLATFPLDGDWTGAAHWADRTLASLLDGRRLEGRLSEIRDETASLLTESAGPVVYHETRGSFIEVGADKYGGFLAEWGAIFERFGIPAEIGLAQALVESGLRGRIRSPAYAVGFCHWLPRNWDRLERLSPYVIEAYNQTTQAPYCAAHLAILTAKYGSLIPALSEHHAGGINVARALHNGEFAGGDEVRDRYFLGAELTLLIRRIRLPGYREVSGGYGPRSFRYAEMIFGNSLKIAEIEAAMPQQPIFAMRPRRAVSL